ncbi:ribonuclease III [Mesosutterella sp. OilRF-GAM-744-9]|uniref:Ribonuclease 3 n=1 Tax=Mesosutterella porci TaxID=2915351 RepID=A0ABS9MPT8_9BURK|nr:ribonuclease III [Mesosutterella sp. oilRF-744-WT-GAM-9]MCG5030557.1 ribonuclease III [Mesosutterella sp. oilRF-744-WT-GAM-9]MCI6530214.1 ribonuclease III [Mesosutterella sp.]
MLELTELEKRIGYAFSNKALLQRAVTHRSFSADHNERLEFLGDSVLGCTIGYELFKMDQHFSEGRLSRVRSNLVCEKALDEIAAEVKISDFLRLGSGELRSGGLTRPSIIADAMEAVFGAVFLDGGFEQAQKVILRLYRDILEDLPERMSKDAKTRLQELLQGNHLPLPVYRVLSAEGQANAKTFRCECFIEKFALRTIGEGTKRQSAEQNAAKAALEALRSLPQAASLKAVES